VYGIVPFTYEGRLGQLPRGKIDLDTLDEVRWMVEGMACVAEAETESGDSGYPHYSLRPRQAEHPTPLFAADAPNDERALDEGTALIDLSDLGIVRVSGWRARPFLNDACTADIVALGIGQGTRSLMLDADGRVIDDVTVWRMPRDERDRDVYLVFTNPGNTDHAVSWMRALSDGYVLFDRGDVWRKVQGPAKVEVLSDPRVGERMAAIALYGPRAGEMLRQALGAIFPDELLAAPGKGWAQIAHADRSTLVTRGGYLQGKADRHVEYGVVGPVAEVRALWDALTRAGAVATAAPEARHALRQAAGLPPAWPDEGVEREAASYLDRVPHLFAVHKPYYVGQDALPPPETAVGRRTFTWSEPSDAPMKRTPLYEEHVRLGARLISFAGWEMPVWYTSVGQEHRAVREAAGLFDVAHMGTLEVSGPYAVDLLDVVGVNYVRWLADGDSQYSALLDADGHILDDIIIYRRAGDRFLVVVNAANFDKDWAWLNAVNANEVILDRQRPWIGVLHPATLRDLKDPRTGPAQRIDIALQGPNSLRILLACVDDAALRARLIRLQRTKFIEGSLGGIDLLISRTGYTGEELGFELYVHPKRAVALWNLLLQRGAPHGIVPCGLAARDSTRIEAGLPLYGHELAGPLNITQSEAGFAAYVKYHKPFFIGRTPYKAYDDASERQVVRFEVGERGVRALRGGEHGEPVVNRRGKVIGAVTSCTLVGDRQLGMALVDRRYTEPGSELFIYPESRRAVSKVPAEFEPGDTVALPVRAVVLPRFPAEQE
jgi:glycine cleavage system T protein